MVKIKALFFIFLFFLVNATIPIEVEKSKNSFTTKQKILIGGVVGVGITAATIATAPAILPASTIVAIKAATTAAAAAIASPVGIETARTIAGGMTTIRLTYKATHFFRWYIYPTEEQELEQLLKEKAQEQPL